MSGVSFSYSFSSSSSLFLSVEGCFVCEFAAVCGHPSSLLLRRKRGGAGQGRGFCFIEVVVVVVVVVVVGVVVVVVQSPNYFDPIYCIILEQFIRF